MTTSDQIAIRFLTGEDAAEYWRLRLEMLEREPQAFSASAEEHRWLGIDVVRERIAPLEEEQFIVGAFERARLAGAVGFYRDKGLKTRHKGHVWGVYVEPQQRGAGLGRKMLETLLQHAAAISGLAQVLLSVAATQTPALRLYESLGFQRWGCEPKALRIGDQYIDELHMILGLK